MKILAFEITIGGVSKIVTDLGSLQAAIKATNNELKTGPKIGSEEYNKLQRQLGSLKEIQKQVAADTRTQGREYVKAADEGKRSYRAINAELVNLRMAFKELSEVERRSGVGKEMIRSIQALDQELKQIDASIGLFQRNVGNYKQALLGIGDLVTGGLLTGGIQKLAQVVKDFTVESINTTADFNRQLGILGQVSGAAFKTIDVEGRGAVNALQLLEEEALRLGATTEFSASQVAQLEINYAKLGFTPIQIFQLLSDTIDTATVSGEDLGRTATVVGVTLRAFNLEATEGGRVADVLAKAFASSSLDLSKFETAVATVGAAGNAVGLTLEEVTAMLGTLTDAGFDASTAATSLRNIFLENAAAGRTLDEGYQEILRSQNQLVDANDKYGKRGAAQAVVLANQIEKTKQLTETLRNAANFGSESAAVIRDDLKGAFDNVSSAIEGLQIALVDRFGPGLKDIVNGFSDFVTNLIDLVNGTGKFKEILDATYQTIQNFIPALVTFGLSLAANNAQVIFAAVTALPQWIVSQGRALLATKAFTVANQALNIVLRANPIGLLITGISLLIGGLVTAYQRSEKFRAVIDGLGATVREVFLIIGEAVGNFIQGFEQLKEGNLSEGFRLFGQGIIKSNPVSIALKEGDRLAKAFNSGYDKSIERSAAEDKKSKVVKAEMASVGEEGAKAATAAGEMSALALDASLQEGMTQTIAQLKARKKILTKELSELDPGSDQFDDVKRELDTVNAKIRELSGTVKDVDIKGPFDQLQERVTELKNKIQDAIVAGTDYSKLLEEYIKFSNDASNAQEVFKTNVEAWVIASQLADGSIEKLTNNVTKLKDEITKAAPSDIATLTAQLIDAEKKLEDAKNEIERARQIAAGGPRSAVLEADIKKDIDNINQVRQVRLNALNTAEVAEAEFAKRREVINLESDISILDKQLSLYREGTEERLKLENELADKRRQLSNIDIESNISNDIRDIEAIRDARILALKDVEASEKDITNQRKVIEQQADVDILKARLRNTELTNNERLALQVQLNDAEIALEKAKNDKILEEKRLFNDRVNEVLTFSLTAVNNAISSIGELQDTLAERRISNLEDYYEREIEQAAGNEDEIARLEQERDSRIRAIQEEQFKRGKRLQIAQAVIGGALAIISTLAAPAGAADIVTFGILRAIQVGLIAATTAAQVATIAAQTFAKGGYTGSSTERPDKTGHRPVGIVHENEYVVPTHVLNMNRGRELVNELERMRIGLPSNTVYHNYVSANSGLFATGGFTSSNIQPNLSNPSSSTIVFQTKQMSDEQIKSIATEIGNKVFDAVYESTIQSNNEVALINARQNRLNNKVG